MKELLRFLSLVKTKIQLGFGGNMSKNMNENEEVSVNPEVMAGVIHDYYNSGIKLAATTIKNYLENIMNSREDAITLCNKMIEDANQTIAEIHEKLGVEE